MNKDRCKFSIDSAMQPFMNSEWERNAAQMCAKYPESVWCTGSDKDKRNCPIWNGRKRKFRRRV